MFQRYHAWIPAFMENLSGYIRVLTASGNRVAMYSYDKIKLRLYYKWLGFQECNPVEK